MNGIGLVFMIVSYVLIVSLCGFCFYRVLRTPGVEKTEHAPLDIDTRDLDT